MFFSLAILPAPADAWAGVGAWSSSLFDTAYSFEIFAIGVILGGLLAVFFLNTIKDAFTRLFDYMRGESSGTREYMKNLREFYGDDF